MNVKTWPRPVTGCQVQETPQQVGHRLAGGNQNRAQASHRWSSRLWRRHASQNGAESADGCGRRGEGVSRSRPPLENEGRVADGVSAVAGHEGEPGILDLAVRAIPVLQLAHGLHDLQHPLTVTLGELAP